MKPDYALGSHVAALGLAMSSKGAYIGEHGAWNRSPPSGYEVVLVPFTNGVPSGPPQKLLSGSSTTGKREDVADDVGNAVWRVSRR